MTVTNPVAESLSYREIAQPLVDYVKRLGFTHVEFLPVSAQAPEEIKTGLTIIAQNTTARTIANALKNALAERNVYAFCRWNMIFVAPPLVETDADLAFGVKAIDEALAIADRYEATGEL